MMFPPVYRGNGARRIPGDSPLRRERRSIELFRVGAVYVSMRWITGVIGLSGLLSAAAAQPPAPMEFEVASIRPSAPLGVNHVNVGVHIDGSQVSCLGLSINDYLGIAYRVKNYQISGPPWMASERFDILAKLPAGAAGKDVPGMLQSLLEDRFHMKLHRETKDLPVYGLIQGRNRLHMQDSAPDAEAPDASGRGGVNVAASGQPGGVNINFGRGSSFTFADDRIEGKKLTTANLADTLTRFTDRPVLDQTHLTGKYDFELQLAPEDFRAMMIRSAIAAGVSLPPQALRLAESASGDSLLSAVEKLGLKLESRKAPIEVLVIDSIDKTPTDN